MARGGIVDHRTEGATYLERIAKAKPPATLAPYSRVFKRAHDAFEAAAKTADDAKAKRDAALALVATADVVLDGTVLDLADEMVTARLGSRTRPFARFSSMAPSQITALAYRKEIDAVRSLAGKIAKTKPAKSVQAKLSSVKKALAGMEDALDDLEAPALAWHRAMVTRDEHLLDWTKALTILKKHANAAWADEPATYKAIFSAKEALPKPKKKRAKKVAKTDAQSAAAAQK